MSIGRACLATSKSGVATTTHTIFRELYDYSNMFAGDAAVSKKVRQKTRIPFNKTNTIFSDGNNKSNQRLI